MSEIFEGRDDTTTLPRENVVSPLNYIGGKGKLLPQILPLLPSCELFVDLFAGGCNVGLNAPSDHVIFNDSNKQLMELLGFLASTDTETIIADIDALVVKYGLSNTYHNSYASYSSNSSDGLGAYNRDGHIRLRDDYNQSTDPTEKNLLLYALIIFSFNNQIRFNNSGRYNLPVGKRDFNARMRKKLRAYHERMSTLSYQFCTHDFQDFDVAATPTDTLFYCDPPYLITHATYNKHGGWSSVKEEALLEFLDGVHASGRKFALSNVVTAKGVDNEILQRWTESSDYHVHNLKMSYDNSNYQRASKGSPTVEVLVTNY